jgi:hypothetical protein
MAQEKRQASTPKAKRAFFITPIGSEGSETRAARDKVLKRILEPALVPALVSEIKPVDHISNPGEITATILTEIIEADLVIADLTGSNANVYYELAIAHAFGRPTVHIRHATADRLPFDVQSINVIDYGFDIAVAEDVRPLITEAARLAMDRPERVQTLLGKLASLGDARTIDTPDEWVALIVDRLDNLGSAVSRLSRQAPSPAPRSREWRVSKTGRMVPFDDGAVRFVPSDAARALAREGTRTAVRRATADLDGPDFDDEP